MSINDLSPQLYLRELTGDYLLFASVLQAYLADWPWAVAARRMVPLIP
jgi:hypothetical protein